MAILDSKIAEVEVAIKAADSAIEKRRLKIKREDLMRLRRVEQIYVRSYCDSSSCAYSTILKERSSSRTF